MATCGPSNQQASKLTHDQAKLCVAVSILEYLPCEEKVDHLFFESALGPGTMPIDNACMKNIESYLCLSCFPLVPPNNRPGPDGHCTENYIVISSWCPNFCDPFVIHQYLQDLQILEYNNTST